MPHDKPLKDYLGATPAAACCLLRWSGSCKAFLAQVVALADASSALCLSQLYSRYLPLAANFLEH